MFTQHDSRQADRASAAGVVYLGLVFGKPNIHSDQKNHPRPGPQHTTLSGEQLKLLHTDKHKTLRIHC